LKNRKTPELLGSCTTKRTTLETKEQEFRRPEAAFLKNRKTPELLGSCTTKRTTLESKEQEFTRSEAACSLKTEPLLTS
jgi:hypothetical protein